MTSEELLNRISNLSTEEQNVVAEFVKFVEQAKNPAPIDTQAVIDAFMDKHAELMMLFSK